MKKSITVFEFKRDVIREKLVEYHIRDNVTVTKAAAKLAVLMIGKKYREHSALILLDARNEVIGYHLLSIGTVSACFVDIKEVMRAVILSGALGFISIHNHPSGNVDPSEDDRKITEDLYRASELLGLKFVDSLIVNGIGNHFSFLEEGLLF